MQPSMNTDVTSCVVSIELTSYHCSQLFSKYIFPCWDSQNEADGEVLDFYIVC